MVGRSFESSVALRLAINDVKTRFSRTILGPIWHTIVLLLTILAMGPIYGSLIAADTIVFTTNLAISLAVWQGISTCIIESCMIHGETKNIYNVVGLRARIGIMRLLVRNYIYFLFSSLAVFVSYLFLSIEIHWSMLSIYIVYPFTLILFSPLIYALSHLSVKFPDITMIIQSIITLMFFISPIVWTPEIIPIDKVQFVVFNPFYYIMEFIRGCFFTLSVELDILSGLALVFVIMFVVSLPFLRIHKNLFFEL